VGNAVNGLDKKKSGQDWPMLLIPKWGTPPQQKQEAARKGKKRGQAEPIAERVSLSHSRLSEFREGGEEAGEGLGGNQRFGARRFSRKVQANYWGVGGEERGGFSRWKRLGGLHGDSVRHPDSSYQREKEKKLKVR